MISPLGKGAGDGRGANAEREARLARLIAAGEGWKAPSAALTDPPWLPDLISADGHRILHLQGNGILHPYMRRRLQRAAELDMEVHVACGIGALYNDALVEGLSPVAAIIHLEEEDQDPDPRSLAITLAIQGIQVAAATRKVLARDEFSRALEPTATATQKGKRFEALIAFLFSQTDGFRIGSTNYETSTEEIDVVIRQLSTQGRIWSRDGPLILVEARNRASGITQEMFSAFRTKLQVKRGRAKLGFMVSSTTVSGPAEHQEEKTALGDIAVVFLDGEDLGAWIEAEDPDAWLERHVERRILQ